MAWLDPSEILLDPDIADSFVYNRRTQTVSTKGRGVTTSVPNTGVGVVTVSSPNDLLRLSEEQRMDRHYSIVTRARLQGPSPGFQADTVLWRGNTYVVKTAEPYPHYGAGWIQAIVGSMDSLDQPPTN